jgi:hypothetical protein
MTARPARAWSRLVAVLALTLAFAPALPARGSPLVEEHPLPYALQRRALDGLRARPQRRRRRVRGARHRRGREGDPHPHRRAAVRLRRRPGARDLRQRPLGGVHDLPKAEDAKKARRDRRTLPTKVGVIELATGAQREFERVRSFRFAGDRSNVIALQHCRPMHPRRRVPAAPAGAPPSGSTGHARGSRRRHTVTLARRGEYASTPRGSTSRTPSTSATMIGNGVQVRELATGVVRALDAGKAMYSRLTWADSGDALAVLRTATDSVTKDTLDHVLGWTRLASRAPVHVTIDENERRHHRRPRGERGPRAEVERHAGDALLRAARAAHAAAALDGCAGRRWRRSRRRVRVPAGVAPAGRTTRRPSLILWHWKDPRCRASSRYRRTRTRASTTSPRGMSPSPRVVQLATMQGAHGDRGLRRPMGLGADVSPVRAAGERRRPAAARSVRDRRTHRRTRDDRAKGIQNPGGGFRIS